MNFTIKELNELLYSLGTTASKGMMVNKELNSSLIDKLYNELSKKLEFYDENGYEQTDEDYKGQFNDWKNETPIESSHYVSNEEADEDFLSTLQQDEQRYEASHMTTSFPITNPFTSEYKPKGVTQSILDFVQLQGDATYTEMQNFYRKEFGSNSFSHILKSLTIPYKNRTTRRYLSKMSNGNYEVRLANPSNWVVVENDFIKWIRGNTK
jgi:hypothetical protein